MKRQMEEESKKRRQAESNDAEMGSQRDRTKVEQEGTAAKRRKQDEPQPGIAEEESRKRKPEGELNVEDRQVSKAQAVEEEDLEDEDMQKVVDVAWCAEEQQNVKRCKEGMVLNLRRTPGWDFSKREHRNEIRKVIAQEKPVLVIGPRMHTSVRNCRTSEEAKVRSRLHQGFMMEIINRQAEEGRMYTHEFVEGAESMKGKECIHTRTRKDNVEVRERST